MISTFIHFALLGLTAGAVYAVLANGLIAVYRATGILNFAQGAMAAWGAYVYASLRNDGLLVLPVGSIRLGEVPMWLALAIGVASAALIGLAAHYLVFSRLRRAPALAQVVASVGIMVVMQVLEVIRFGGDAISVAEILPMRSTEIAGVNVPVGALWLAAIAIVLSVGSWAYFRYTRSGVATRAGAESERALRLMGYSPDRLAAVVWGATAGIGGLVITLAAPSIGLDSITYTWAVIPALSVALLSRLTSMATAVVAGLGLGAFQAIVIYLSLQSWYPSWAVSGVRDTIPFVVIIIALILFGGRMPSRGSLGEIKLPRVTIPKLRPVSVTATIVVASVLLVVSSGGYRFGVLTSIILVLLALSYVLLTGYLGQISLAQLAFAGVSGLGLSKLTTDLHVPFPLSILISASLAAILGLAVGLPALRIRGAQLAVVTLALAVAAENFVFNNSKLNPLSGNLIENPTFFGIDLSVRKGTDPTRLVFCFVVLAIVVVVTLLVAKMLQGDTGRAFLAVRSNERAAASVGINVAWCKLIGFVLSAFIAGIAGALIGYSRGQLSGDSFAALTGLSLLAIAYLGGIGSMAGALIAGLNAPLGLIYVFFNDTVDLGNYYVLISGIGLIATAIFQPAGIAPATQEGIEKAAATIRRRRQRPPDPMSHKQPLDPAAPREGLAHVQ